MSEACWCVVGINPQGKRLVLQWDRKWAQNLEYAARFRSEKSAGWSMSESHGRCSMSVQVLPDTEVDRWLIEKELTPEA